MFVRVCMTLGMYANASISPMVKLYLKSCHPYLYTVADNIFTTAVILI